ncbi:sensor histidine kinase [Amycolatopsis sp., V23-08]|uniref:histidine kinase n=1 Tax=Amycolatopsis heterodermiae TaxID=3110235 RepID=A0ABU5R9R6_9PSEU|nr:sensor histidine kinase [Amycolatopsis sp., V23-08]MEA5362972.1 sensor histidine kinase [Amycolatopsis sp., V23-08]
MRHPRALSSLILGYVLAILVVTMVLGFALYTQVTRDLLDRYSERQALSVAEAVAADPAVRAGIAGGDRTGAVQRVAEDVRTASGAAYVVVIDRDGIRHSHPNPALVGRRIEEPVIALDGRSHVGLDAGSLGDSANGKAPLRAPDGTLAGEVSVGILETDVSQHFWAEVPTLLRYTGAALLAGTLIALVLARRLKRMTFGLELHELASLLQEREATLHGIREGVVAFDRQGRLTMVNDEARRLLRWRSAELGRTLDEVVPEGRLREVLGGDGIDQIVLTDEHLLVANRMPVRVRGRDVGSVVTLRDRTELEALLRELDSVTGLTDALRAQQHEFSNRLHVLSVLVGMGDQEEAMAYLDEISAGSTGQAEELRSRIAPASLAALLLAKITIAAERDVRLTVSEDSRLDQPAPDALLTIVGNLVDNALDAVADTPAPREVVVRLAHDDGAIAVSVTDSGPGVPAGLAERVFQDGYTTKPSRSGLPRGLGLALVHRLVVRLGGRITVAPGPGGAFDVRLPVRAGERP